MNDSKITRRTLLRISATAAAGVPLATVSTWALAQAEPVNEEDPTAIALGYRHDTAQVDAARFPQHSADQNCANCQLYTGADGEEWGPCAVFPGKQVNADGWCSAWVRKAG